MRRSPESRACVPKTRSCFDPQAALRLYGETVRDLRNNEPAAMVSDGRTTKLSTIEDQTQMQFMSIADWPSITLGFIGAHASKGKVLGQGSGWCALGIPPPPPELITAPASKLSATPCAWTFVDLQHASPPPTAPVLCLQQLPYGFPFSSAGRCDSYGEGSGAHSGCGSQQRQPNQGSP